MTIQEKLLQGRKEAIVSRGKNKGSLKATCPRMNTYGAAVWQAFQFVFNPMKVSIGACLMMDDDVRSVYDYSVELFDNILNGKR